MEKGEQPALGGELFGGFELRPPPLPPPYSIVSIATQPAAASPKLKALKGLVETRIPTLFWLSNGEKMKQ